MSDAKDIATTSTGRAVAQFEGQSSAAAMLGMIHDALINPNIEAAKLVALTDVAIKLKALEQVEQFNFDKAAAIMEMPSIRRDGRIIIPGKGSEPDRIQGRFVKYESLQAVIDPILSAHNLVLTHNVDGTDNRITVQPVLTHRNGYVEKGGKMPLPLDTSGGKNNVQAAGSSVSYGMRYTACAMLHIRIHGIDDDGNGGEEGTSMDRLSAEQRELVDAGRSAAMRGSDHYTEWFKALSTAEKGWLVYEPYHGQNKEAAALADKV